MFFEGDDLDWAREGASWPNAAASRFVRAAGLTWHVQRAGNGPTALLLHGAGAATHSWRALLPLLAERFDVVAPDLPGHGFTSSPHSYRLTLPGMAAMVSELLDALEARPEIVVGHSAGAAIALRMTLDGRIAPRVVVSVNGALKPFQGLGGMVFPAMARLLFINPLAPRYFARSARDRRRVERLIRSTGSELDADGLALYARLLGSRRHVAGTLGMMAHWNLEPLLADLPRLAARLALVVGERDRAVRPSDAEDAERRAPNAAIWRLPGLGHLAHEEDPEAVARIVFAAAEEDGAPPPASGV